MLCCFADVYRRSNGIGGLAKTTKIRSACGLPAVELFRGLRLRRDGSVFLMPWQPHCRRHADPSWESEMRAKYPVGDRQLVARL